MICKWRPKICPKHLAGSNLYSNSTAMYMYNRANYHRAKKQFIIARNSFVLFITLMLILPFHYVTGGFRIIPKNQWGFAHTIVTESDIIEALHDYNTAGKSGKDEIIEQAWVQKMIYERNVPTDMTHY
jgi:hypothetical protein